VGIILIEKELIMREMKKSGGMLFILVLAAILMTACGNTPEMAAEPEATPTPTEVVLLLLPTEEPNPCDGLTGTIEMQVLVGPSEAVGMEPVSVGNIPFSVSGAGRTYLASGGGPLLFDEQVYEAEWGTYTVNFSADTTIQGSCLLARETATLDLIITMDGEQKVVVEAEGFEGEYPWSGTREISAVLPAVEGASVSGEGWVVVLHLGQ